MERRGPTAADLLPEQVFIPNSYPRLTYIERAEGYDRQLADALRRVGSVVSLTGRSKSGKTVLVQKVVGPEHAAIINCGITPTADQFWAEVLRSLGQPEERALEATAGESRTLEGGGGVSGGLPHLLEGHAEVGLGHESTSGRTERASSRPGPTQAIGNLVSQRRTLVIDDFHYLSGAAQQAIGESLRAAVHSGVPIVILSVPHHGDDPVQAVPDLRGRVLGIQLAPWSEEELCEIASTGFTALNLQIAAQSARRLARESIGSPQLMQLLCLEACLAKNIRSKRPALEALELSEADFRHTMERAARSIDFSTLFRKLHSGPKPRGVPRNEYRLTDGSRGDVYHVLLAAVASDPLLTTMQYSVLKTRVERVCVAPSAPTGPVIQAVVARMSDLARQHGGAGSGQRDPAMEWLQGRAELALPDPYFLFYLRWEAFPQHEQRGPVGSV